MLPGSGIAETVEAVKLKLLIVVVGLTKRADAWAKPKTSPAETGKLTDPLCEVGPAILETGVGTPLLRTPKGANAKGMNDGTDTL